MGPGLRPVSSQAFASGISVRKAGFAIMAWAGAGAHRPRAKKMESAMSLHVQSIDVPGRIAFARNERGRYAARWIRIRCKRTQRLMRIALHRFALAWLYRQELAMLARADDRMLMDIGLTRADVRSAIESPGWLSPGRMLEAASARRRDAIETAHNRRTERYITRGPATVPALPVCGAPALAPDPDGHAIETANYR
jgi:uncharacterized protein YjiS (DUF1127 family)